MVKGFRLNISQGCAIYVTTSQVPSKIKPGTGNRYNIMISDFQELSLVWSTPNWSGKPNVCDVGEVCLDCMRTWTQQELFGLELVAWRTAAPSRGTFTNTII
jgi:hypothetical protein